MIVNSEQPDTSNQKLLQDGKNQTYILIIENKANKRIKVGKWGVLYFKKGYYLYIGSAKKNLNARIKRHLAKNKKKFWHIDYLLSSNHIFIKEVWVSKIVSECQIAQKFFNNRYSFINKFGSSDCNCFSHLFFMEGKFDRVENLLK